MMVVPAIDEMMRYFGVIVALSCALGTVSCESVRKVYDSSGEEVKDRKPGEYSSLEERFTGGFSTKKNAMGFEQADSKKVSPFQAKIDQSRDVSKQSSFQGKVFGGSNKSAGSKEMSYTESLSQFAGKKQFKDSSKTAYTPDDVPDFMKGGRGIVPEKYADSNRKMSDSDRKYDVGEAYDAVMSSTSREDRSTYFESKPEVKMPVYSKDEYARKTIEDTRGMLRRDNPKD